MSGQAQRSAGTLECCLQLAKANGHVYQLIMHSKGQMKLWGGVHAGGRSMTTGALAVAGNLLTWWPAQQLQLVPPREGVNAVDAAAVPVGVANVAGTR